MTEQEEIGRELERYLSKIADRICPHCNKAIEEQKQVGRCVYAFPCYHRLFQGKAKAKEKPIHPYFREQESEERP